MDTVHHCFLYKTARLCRMQTGVCVYCALCVRRPHELSTCRVPVWCRVAESVVDDGKVVSNWHCRAQLGDAKKSVNDVEFAPRYLGLKLVRAA